MVHQQFYMMQIRRIFHLMSLFIKLITIQLFSQSSHSHPLPKKGHKSLQTNTKYKDEEIFVAIAINPLIIRVKVTL